MSHSYNLCRLLTGFSLTLNQKNPHFNPTSPSVFTHIYFSGSHTSMPDAHKARYLDRLPAPVSNRYLYFIHRLLQCKYTYTPIQLHTYSAIHLSVTVLSQFSRPFTYSHVWTEFDDNTIGDATCWTCASSISHAECTVVYTRTLIISNRTKTKQRTASRHKCILCMFRAVISYSVCK